MSCVRRLPSPQWLRQAFARGWSISISVMDLEPDWLSLPAPVETLRLLPLPPSASRSTSRVETRDREPRFHSFRPLGSIA